MGGVDNLLLRIVRNEKEFLDDTAAFFSKSKEKNSPSSGGIYI